MGEVQKGYHCAWQIHYHIVFPVKYRKALLDREVVEIIRETAIGIQKRYEIEIEAMGTDYDHIHILCGAHPKISAGRIVQIFNWPRTAWPISDANRYDQRRYPARLSNTHKGGSGCCIGFCGKTIN
ncbi:MAG: IS200/IS605 family transposase [Nitrospirae bacterium]|nr:IS200/IS605 family transposase [Nitrospirota bacterium]